MNIYRRIGEGKEHYREFMSVPFTANRNLKIKKGNVTREVRELEK